MRRWYFSKKLIAEDDGDRLPVYIDLSSDISNQKMRLLWNVNYSGNTLVSENYYNPKNVDLFCESATTLCDIGLVATDNGLYDKMTGPYGFHSIRGSISFYSRLGVGYF